MLQLARCVRNSAGSEGHSIMSKSVRSPEIPTCRGRHFILSKSLFYELFHVNTSEMVRSCLAGAP